MSRIGLALALWAGLLSRPGLQEGQETEPPPPPPPKTVIPLGPLGGTADVFHGTREAVVTAVHEGAPAAQAGLQVGDKIVAANGREFEVWTTSIDEGGKGPPEGLGLAIEESEGDEAGGRLDLTVRRGEEELSLECRLPVAGRFAPKFPAGCEKSRAMLDGICRQIRATQRADGAWQALTGLTADRFNTALLGLVLLSRGDPDHLPAIRRAVTYLLGADGKVFLPDDFSAGPGGLDSWPLVTTTMFLAEYRIATGDESVLPALQRLCDAFAARMNAEGKMGHSNDIGYGGKGFNIVNTQVHLAWALAGLAGCEIDEEAWQLSFEQIRASTGDNGGVRYWTLETGYGDASARTGSMALALALTGREPELASRMGEYLAVHRRRMREAHAMGSIGMIYGTAALELTNPEGYRIHLDDWIWYLDLMRQPDGTVAYIGSKGNNGGDYYLGFPHVAAAIAGLMLATGEDHLRICGGTGPGWLPVEDPVVAPQPPSAEAAPGTTKDDSGDG